MSELLNNRYRIVKTLGGGGFGETFLAEDTNSPSRRLCVIKRLKPQTDDAATWELIKERFEREAAILETLGDECSQIPSLKAYFDSNQEFYLVQDYIDGANLCEIVKAEGRFDEKRVREFLQSILPVLDFVHSQGKIHRDIKPENIMRRARDGKYLLIDFGAVKEVATTVLDRQGVATSSIIIGTNGYMPLEQSAGRPVFASDIFSLGLTAVYLLTGKRPAEMNNLATGKIEWRQHSTSVSNNLAATLDKAIEEQARDRFQSAKQMLAALQPAAAEPPKPAPIPANWQNKTPAERDTVVAGKESGKIAVNVTAPQNIGNLPTPLSVRNANSATGNRQVWLIGGGIAALAVLIGFIALMSSFSSQSENGNSNLMNANVGSSNSNQTSANGNRTGNGNAAAPVYGSPLSVKNSIGMEFVKIPSGSFTMGDDESSRFDEKPAHQVTISRDFYMGKTEVTQAQWQAVMGNNPSPFNYCPKCPVENVSWDDAQEFIRKLIAKKEGIYRLPTEAEWEYAARAGTTGDYAGNLDAMAWYDKNSGDKTHEVGTKRANNFGLYDMHGNVWEWCSDWYGNYSPGAKVDPTGAISGANRVARGGGWDSVAVRLRSTHRLYNSPSYRSAFLGFRVVRMVF